MVTSSTPLPLPLVQRWLSDARRSHCGRFIVGDGLRLTDQVGNRMAELKSNVYQPYSITGHSFLENRILD